MNKQIVELIWERLEVGKREYSEELDVHDGRNWTEESLQEVLDLCVYLSAEIIKRNEPKKYKYLVTARLSHFENETFLVINKNKQKIDLKKIKKKIFWALNEQEDVRDVHIVSVCEINSDFKCEILEGSNCTLYKEDYA